MSDEYLTTEQVAEILQTTDRTVRTLIQGGKLKAIRLLKRRYRVKRSDLEKYIEDAAV